MPATAADREDARRLPDEFAALRADPPRAITALVDVHWADRPVHARRELGQALLSLLDPVLRDGRVTEETRAACEQTIVEWLNRTDRVPGEETQASGPIERPREFTATGVRWTVRRRTPGDAASPPIPGPTLPQRSGLYFVSNAGEHRFLLIDRATLPSQRELYTMPDHELLSLLRLSRLLEDNPS